VNQRRVKIYLYGEDILYPENFVPYYKNQPKHSTVGSEGPQSNNVEPEIPYCDRCHNLVHQGKGVPIVHPTMNSINEMLDESPHKRNHVYHILDAADFPMSMIPNLHERLELGHIRSRNRRAKHQHFARGKETDMSFIITRSDLLAPKKEQVDALLPKLQEILRKSMGHFGKHARIHLRCVSAHRGWWTKTVKEEIWHRGGGQWLVGKANVGKSGLLESVFPKGEYDRATPKASTLSIEETEKLVQQLEATEKAQKEKGEDEEPKVHNLISAEMPTSFSLLPPAQPLYKYPTMPVVSSLPGTTASPIRIPFGLRKGELIDLPGLDRHDLSSYVKVDEQKSLVMKSRIKPERIVIKPGSSLLLGGLIRITPLTPDQIVMAHVFVPIKPHLTNTEKAIGLHTGVIQSETIPSIATPEAQQTMALAGTFSLDTDITRAYAGTLTSKSALKMKPEDLPFIVYGTDILIAGCGWIELVAQVRRKPRQDAISQMQEMAGINPTVEYPKVEVWSPEGQGIGHRMCIQGWQINKSLNLT
jgi:hypothetical protein